MGKEGAEPVKAHKFHTKASKQVTVLEETPEEDDDEPEPEDDSFDRDEPIGAGAGDFVEEGDDEMAEEFQAVQAVVALGARAHEAAQRVCLVPARVAAILVDL